MNMGEIASLRLSLITPSGGSTSPLLEMSPGNFGQKNTSILQAVTTSSIGQVTSKLLQWRIYREMHISILVGHNVATTTWMVGLTVRTDCGPERERQPPL